MKDNRELMLLIYHMLNELALELGYTNGAQDLSSEEPAANIQLMQIVQERLEAQVKLRQEASDFMRVYS